MFSKNLGGPWPLWPPLATPMILAVATIWNILLDVFFWCVQDFCSSCRFGRYISSVVCLVFGKLCVSGTAVEHSEEKRCKVDIGHMFFQKFNRDVFVCLPSRNYNSVSASQAWNTQCRVIERCWPKARTSAVIAGHSQ